MNTQNIECRVRKGGLVQSPWSKVQNHLNAECGMASRVRVGEAQGDLRGGSHGQTLPIHGNHAIHTIHTGYKNYENYDNSTNLHFFFCGIYLAMDDSRRFLL